VVDGFEQGGFTGSIDTQDCHYSAGGQGEGDAVQDGVAVVTESEIGDFEFHFRNPLISR
jgi:hypothetical protein